MTGRRLELHHFNKDAKLFGVSFDADPAQFQGWKAFLAEMQEFYPADQQCQDLQWLALSTCKVCAIHFERYVSCRHLNENLIPHEGM